MSFTCPKCLRPLTRANSWHYCKRITYDELFEQKPAQLRLLFEDLLQGLQQWPGVRASASKTCIVFLHQKTFLIVKVMKTELDLKFVLAAESDEFPIYKKQAYGKKLEHYIRLSDRADLDKTVWRLLRESYELCGANPPNQVL